MLRCLLLTLSFAAPLALGAFAAEDAPPPPPQPDPRAGVEEEPAAKLDEPAIRRKFMLAFTSAEKPEAKADAVYILKGMREKDSLKLLTGLLGDSLPTVRRNACRVMSETPDAEGYFVKPLTAALYDRNYMVRASAADALSSAKVKEAAVKALVFALTETAQEGVKLASYAHTLDDTLSKLTGKQFGKTDDLKKLAQWWNEFWTQNGKSLAQADEAYLRKLSGKPDDPAEKTGDEAKTGSDEKSPAPAESKTGALKTSAEKTPGKPKVEDE
ncbi:MAG: HEAT repeat domain-containing protein [Planctomycetes bacterium]|nr:HEAT repeat domain-containing protein [Planctomycetota bacterium]